MFGRRQAQVPQPGLVLPQSCWICPGRCFNRKTEWWCCVNQRGGGGTKEDTQTSTPHWFAAFFGKNQQLGSSRSSTGRGDNDSNHFKIPKTDDMEPIINQCIWLGFASSTFHHVSGRKASQFDSRRFLLKRFFYQFWSVGRDLISARTAVFSACRTRTCSLPPDRSELVFSDSQDEPAGDLATPSSSISGMLPNMPELPKSVCGWGMRVGGVGEGTLSTR